jgi:hypothetical protein
VGYDPVSNRLIVFGGRSNSVTNLNDVTVLVDANGIGDPHWITLAPTGTPPPARGNATAAYDPLTNRLIVFGGRTHLGTQHFNDVWVLTNANGLGEQSEWVHLAPAGTPPAQRGMHSAVYDTNSQRLIVFGGLDSSVGDPYLFFDDAWVLTGANGLHGTPQWRKLQPQGPLPTACAWHSVGYGGAANRMVVAMGRNDRTLAPHFFNDVWVLTNASGQCTAGQPCSYDVEATDADAGDVLTFALDTAPVGMTIDTATGLIEWTPTPAQIGTHDVTVRVHDSGGLTAAQRFTLTVAPVAVPNVVGLDPASAEALIGAADLSVGTMTSIGGAITLHFDSLPSEQGWLYEMSGTPAPESRVFSVQDGILSQNSIGIGFAGSGGNGYNLYDVIDRRLPFALSVRARVLAEEGDLQRNAFGLWFGLFTDTQKVGIGLGTSKIDDIHGRFVSTTIDNTQLHEYRLEGTPGFGYQIFVDHTLLGFAPEIQVRGRNHLSFGDGTGGTNARAEVTAYAFIQPRVIAQNPPAGTLVQNKPPSI